MPASPVIAVLTPLSAHLARLRQHRLWRPTTRTLTAALAGLALLWTLGWLVLPWLAKGPLERAASAALGRQVTVGQLEVHPWSLEVTVRDIAVAGTGDGPPLLTIERIHADGELQSLLRWAPVIDALQIEQPVLHLTHHGGGRYDIDDVLDRLLAPADPPPPPGSGPARLALYNLTLSGGQITLADDGVGARHQLSDLTVRVPFISTLPSARAVKIQPLLSFTLNGSRFDSSAEGTPFAQTHAGGAVVRWQGIDLAPYLAYLPARLPVRPQAATLDLDLQLAFEQGTERVLKLTGTAQARDARLVDRDGATLLAWKTLSVGLADVQPLARIIRLGHIEWTAPVLQVQRDADGQVNLAQRDAAAPTSTTPDKDSAPPWRVAVERASVRAGTLRWSDATTQPAARLEATDLHLEATALAWPQTTPATLQGHLALGTNGTRTLAWTGEATDQQAQLTLTLDRLGLAPAAPYLAQWLVPTLDGQLTGTLGVQWQRPESGRPEATTGLTVTAGPLTLEQLALRTGAGQPPLASLARLDIQGLQLGLDNRTVAIERLALNQPRAALARDAQGVWMWQAWLRPAPETPPGAVPADEAKAPTDPTARADRPWAVRVADFGVQGGAFTWSDRTTDRPVALEVSALNLAARDVTPEGSTPQALSASARIATGGGVPGTLAFEGTLAPQPLAAQGRLQATQVPLHALDGYLAGQLSVALQRADASYRGTVALAQNTQGLRLRAEGDAEIDQLRALATAASASPASSGGGRETREGDALVAWKSLNLRGIDLATAPGIAPRLAVRETSLTDFFARIAIDEAGRMNLGELIKPSAPVPASTGTTPTSTPAAAQALPPELALGPVTLVNGQVLFSDDFIRPRYAADLTELTGRLGALATTPTGSAPVLADLALRGRAQGTGTLEITGQLNPLVSPPLLDITGKVRELELPPLTPYAIKYAGHGIERGKLGVDVTYQVQADGQLTANNRVLLQQLTFGEPVAGAPRSLPVRLAVALLADRNGVIDLNLPVSGSLNDPEFRLGPVIGQLVVQLIGKALTSPFQLLASALGGGGSELSSVAFAPGSAVLAPQARQSLDRVVQALAERPRLQITVTGTAHLEQEREALQREALAQLLLAEKRRAFPQDTRPVQPEETAALLKAAYARADIPKPRNLVGLARELTDTEMQALLLAHLPATPAQASALAQNRARTVRDYLVAQNLPSERIFVGAPRTGTPPEGWTPRSELSLATQ